MIEHAAANLLSPTEVELMFWHKDYSFYAVTFDNFKFDPFSCNFHEEHGCIDYVFFLWGGVYGTVCGYPAGSMSRNQVEMGYFSSWTSCNVKNMCHQRRFAWWGVFCLTSDRLAGCLCFHGLALAVQCVISAYGIRQGWCIENL
jgi:hypothetical protein